MTGREVAAGSGRELLAWARARLARGSTWRDPAAGDNAPAPTLAPPAVELPHPRSPADPVWSAGLGLGASRAEDLLEQVADEALLLRVWGELWEDDSRDDYIAASVRSFGRQPLQQLSNLRRSLLEQSWRPGPVVSFELGPERRVLRVSQVPDRLVERALAAVLAPILDEGFSPYSFGFRRGLGVADAASALSQAGASGAQFVLRTDIARAFDEVPRAAVLELLAARIADSRVVGMVALLLERLDDSGADGVGIAQGSSISPLLLNLYLDQLDRHLLRLGYLPIHYADDYAIPVPDAEAGLALVDDLSALVTELGLRLNDDKTDIVAFADGVEFLGQRVSGAGDPSLHPGHSHPRRISVYVPGPGALCRLASGRLRVDRDGETVQAIALARVRQLVVAGRVGLTAPLLHAAATAGTDVVLVTETGGFVGRLARRRGGDVRIRQAQFRAADDEAVAMALARLFVAGKIANQRVAVLRAPRDLRWSAAGSARCASSLEAAAGYALQAESLASLMGVEGAASRAYFQWMADGLPREWGFDGRNRRPPRDPINAMLSYGYTLLSAEMISACEIAHLDPDLGFLHSPRWGRPALALDLMEQWRPVLVDQLVLRLANDGRLRPDQFVVTAQSGARMHLAARRILVAAYEHRLLTLARRDADSGKRAYRELLGIDAAALGQALLECRPERYRGFRWK